MNKILWFLCVCLLYSNSIADDFPVDDDIDDDAYNTNININLFNTFNDCITNNNVIYNYKTNFEYECNCIKHDKCFNSLLNSSTFNKLYIKYNNSTIYLNKLNYTEQCQKYKNYYIYHIIDIYTFCSTYIILYVFLILLLIVGSITFSNYRCRNKRYTKINNEVPPDYDAIN
jgi:hypothetical protein